MRNPYNQTGADEKTGVSMVSYELGKCIFLAKDDVEPLFLKGNVCCFID